MTIAIVIGTHGWAAEQLLKTAEMLLGEQENVGWIDFVPGENAETLIEKYNAQLAKLDTSKGVLFLVDRFKRKTIIIYGFAIMATLHLIIAAVDYTLVGDLKATAIWLLGALFVGVMQGSMGFITWVVLAELFPLKFRGLSMGISVFFMWIMNAVVSYLFPLLQAKLGLGPVFFIFAAINYLAILFVVFALPETSNKSLEQLEAELSANHEDKKSTRLTREVGYDR